MDYGTIPHLEDSVPLKLELSDPSQPHLFSSSKAHLEEERTTETKLGVDIYRGEVSSSATTVLDGHSPQPASPPRHSPRSPMNARKHVARMASLDDSYCDRIRSKSSFGWYDESAAFDTVDVPPPVCCQIEDWRNLEVWDGGKKQAEHEEAALDVEFVVPHDHVTATKTFRQSKHGFPEAYALAIGSTRVIRVSPFASHAEYQVLLSTKHGVYKSWKRYSDFKLLAEYAKISNLEQTAMVWKELQQTQRWFRCLEANYLKTKCELLEKFLAQLLFDVPTPALLLTFVGAQQPDLAVAEWEKLVEAAKRLSTNLSSFHAFVLSNALGRPIVILGDGFIRGRNGEACAPSDMRGIYLPTLKCASTCYPTPIVIGYTCEAVGKVDHFTALVGVTGELGHIPFVKELGVGLPVR